MSSIRRRLGQLAARIPKKKSVLMTDEERYEALTALFTEAEAKPDDERLQQRVTLLEELARMVT